MVIDFSVPAGTRSILADLPGTKNPAGGGHHRFGIGTASEHFAKRPRRFRCLWSPSMSLAVNLAMKLAEMAGPALKDHPGGADVEIIERHHRFKEDAPSGTALKFGEIIAAAMGQTRTATAVEAGPANARTAKSATTPCAPATIPGEHTIVFGLLGETLEMTVPRDQSRLLRPRRPGRREVPGRQAGGTVFDERRAGTLARDGDRGRGARR